MLRQDIKNWLFSGVFALLIGLILTMGFKGAPALARIQDAENLVPVTAQDMSALATFARTSEGAILPALLAGSGGFCCPCDLGADCAPAAPKQGFIRLARANEPVLMPALDSQPPRDPPRI